MNTTLLPVVETWMKSLERDELVQLILDAVANEELGLADFITAAYENSIG